MSQLVAVGATANIRRSWSIAGDPAPADAPPTYTVTDLDGATVTSGTSTLISGATYGFDLDPQPAPQQLQVVWAGVWSGEAQTFTTTVEVVSHLLFTEADARSIMELGAAQWTDERIADSHDVVAGALRRASGVHPMQRHIRETRLEYVSTSDRGLPLYEAAPRTVTALTVADVAQTGPFTILAPLDVVEYAPLSSGQLSWTVDYTAGLAEDPETRHVALLALRFLFDPRQIAQSRVLSHASELGVTRFATPGFGGARFGLPYVDQWCADVAATWGTTGGVAPV